MVQKRKRKMTYLIVVVFLSVLGVSSDFWVLTVGIRNSTPQKHPERLRTQRQWGKSSLFLYFGPWSSVWNGVWHFGSEMGQIRSQQNTLPKFQGVHHPHPSSSFSETSLPSPHNHQLTAFDPEFIQGLPTPTPPLSSSYSGTPLPSPHNHQLTEFNPEFIQGL